MYNIKTGYTHRDHVIFFNDTRNTDRFQNSIYKHAKQIVENNNYRSILDIGCGSGYKLIKYFTGYDILGVDLPRTVNFLNNKYPDQQWQSIDIENDQKQIERAYDVVLAVDIIEHLMNPDILLRFIDNIDFKSCIISTPERDICSGVDHMGPPRNNHHVREWNKQEFIEYISTVFNVTDHLIVNRHEQFVVCTKK